MAAASAPASGDEPALRGREHAVGDRHHGRPSVAWPAARSKTSRGCSPSNSARQSHAANPQSQRATQSAGFAPSRHDLQAASRQQHRHRRRMATACRSRAGPFAEREAGQMSADTVFTTRIPAERRPSISSNRLRELGGGHEMPARSRRCSSSAATRSIPRRPISSSASSWSKVKTQHSSGAATWMKPRRSAPGIFPRRITWNRGATRAPSTGRSR